MAHCTTCGRKQPCQPCHDRRKSDAQEQRLDALYDALKQEPPREILVWFDMSPALARQALNRLMQEWPGTLEVIEPELPEDMLGCLLNRGGVGRGYPLEFEITETRIQSCDNFWLEKLVESDVV